MQAKPPAQRPAQAKPPAQRPVQGKPPLPPVQTGSPAASAVSSGPYQVTPSSQRGSSWDKDPAEIPTPNSSSTSKSNSGSSSTSKSNGSSSQQQVSQSPQRVAAPSVPQSGADPEADSRNDLIIKRARTYNAAADSSPLDEQLATLSEHIADLSAVQKGAVQGSDTHDIAAGLRVQLTQKRSTVKAKQTRERNAATNASPPPQDAVAERAEAPKSATDQATIAPGKCLAFWDDGPQTVSQLLRESSLDCTSDNTGEY